MKILFHTDRLHFPCWLSLGLALALGWLLWSAPVRAEDATSTIPMDAAPLFETHCAGCHINGGNIIRRGKNLKQRALKRNGYEDVDAIATLITNGKGNMSAYGDKLSSEEINALAQYVLDRAAVNWH